MSTIKADNVQTLAGASAKMADVVNVSPTSAVDPVHVNLTFFR